MTNASIGFSCCCALAGLSIAWTGMARAQVRTLTPLPSAAPPGIRAVVSPVATRKTQVETWSAVSDSRLDATRGGFDVGNGLLASFGIERVVYINGNLVSSVSVQIPDIARMTPEQASALSAVTSTLNVIQNGPGNVFDPATLNRAIGATVIQNSLDNQDIQSVTTLDVAVNSLNTFRSLNLQTTLQAASIGSLGH